MGTMRIRYQLTKRKQLVMTRCSRFVRQVYPTRKDQTSVGIFSSSLSLESHQREKTFWLYNKYRWIHKHERFEKVIFQPRSYSLTHLSKDFFPAVFFIKPKCCNLECITNNMFALQYLIQYVSCDRAGEN